MGSNRAEKTLYNLLEFSTAYAGALRHYIAEYFKERGTTAEGEVQAERPISPWQADARVERKPRTARRAAPGIGRSANASYRQERTRSAQPP